MAQERTHGISDSLMSLIVKGIDHGIELAEDGGRFIPVMLTESTITVLAMDTMDEVFAVVRKTIASGEVERCALVYDSYLTVGGERTDAVIVEGYERGRDKGVRIAQRYRPATRARLFRRARPLERVGNLAFLADVAYKTET